MATWTERSLYGTDYLHPTTTTTATTTINADSYWEYSPITWDDMVSAAGRQTVPLREIGEALERWSGRLDSTPLFEERTLRWEGDRLVLHCTGTEPFEESQEGFDAALDEEVNELYGNLG